jgi:hypothetical protein
VTGSRCGFLFPFSAAPLALVDALLLVNLRLWNGNDLAGEVHKSLEGGLLG